MHAPPVTARARQDACANSARKRASARSRKCHTRVHASPQVRPLNYAAFVGGSRFLEVDPIAGGNANDYDYCYADPINCTDLDGRYSYSHRYNLGRGNHRDARALMNTIKNDPDRFFPFSVKKAADGSKARIILGTRLTLSGQYRIGDVEVSGVGSTWFSFNTMPGHVEGAAASVMFSIEVSGGNIYLQVDAQGPDGRAGNAVTNAIRSSVARDLWSGMAASINCYRGTATCV